MIKRRYLACRLLYDPLASLGVTLLVKGERKLDCNLPMLFAIFKVFVKLFSLVFWLVLVSRVSVCSVDSS